MKMWKYGFSAATLYAWEKSQRLCDMVAKREPSTAAAAAIISTPITWKKIVTPVKLAYQNQVSV
jgi:hypothetical protein